VGSNGTPPAPFAAGQEGLARHYVKADFLGQMPALLGRYFRDGVCWVASFPVRSKSSRTNCLRKGTDGRDC
jgi:hypothetical protein